jgi:hypothetical protein
VEEAHLGGLEDALEEAELVADRPFEMITEIDLEVTTRVLTQLPSRRQLGHLSGRWRRRDGVIGADLNEQRTLDRSCLAQR